MSDGGQWVTIALLGKPWGNRGELSAVSLSSKPERFANLEEVTLFGEGERHRVESVSLHKGSLLFKFAGVDSISQAETLRGNEVRVPLAERVPAEPGEYFHSDLIGCAVFDGATGNRIGEVSGVADGLLELDGNVLIPFASAICPLIDVAARRIEVDLPQGLLEINNT